MNSTVCAVQRPMDKDEAAALSRALRRTSRVHTKVHFCEPCEAFHLVSPLEVRRHFDPHTIKVLELCARGLTASEIAMDTNKSRRSIEHTIVQARLVMGALSLAHLLVLATCLGIIDPLQLLPKITENPHDGERSISS